MIKLPSLVHNILALSVVQLGNFLVPLLALPYLARILGPQTYGQIVWVQTIMLLGCIWVDFGFGWSATRNISLNRDNPLFVSKLFSNVWFIQWIMFILFVVVTLGGAFFFLDADAYILYASGMGQVLGQVLLPIWLFQGLESLYVIALIQFLSKLFIFPLLLVFVKDSRDYLWALWIFSASYVFSGILAIFWLFCSKKVKAVIPDCKGVFLALKEGSVLFGSRALISGYTTLIPLAVGWWAGEVQLAYYHLADRFRQAIQAVQAPTSQAMFPRMSWLLVNDPSAAKALLYRVTLLMIAMSMTAGLILCINADFWVRLLGGDDFSQGASVLRWMSFVPCFVALSNLMGMQFMLPRGMNKPFTIILAFASLLSFFLIYPMIFELGANGAAQLVLIVEVFVTAAMALYLFHYMREKNLN